MVKVIIDSATCVGCGLCEESCPEVFEVQGDGLAHLKAQACTEHNLAEIAEQCPVNCIKVS
ncbi:MAG: ferredoxin [Candidatus Omnitrophica bacterium]|nr:ferredoxin [Candidatus Omnitrophota bacterium]MBU1906469.1 ferredoxin [Candidatus Omnitrophota bacterium]